jgi:hypothetical protein
VSLLHNLIAVQKLLKTNFWMAEWAIANVVKS